MGDLEKKAKKKDFINFYKIFNVILRNMTRKMTTSKLCTCDN